MRALIRSSRARNRFGIGVNRIVLAIDGKDALSLLDAERDINLILCDWHMHPMDGLSFCAEVKENSRLRARTIPIVFMTGDEKLLDPDKLRRIQHPIMAIGVTEIVNKPISTERLRDIIQRLCRQAR